MGLLGGMRLRRSMWLRRSVRLRHGVRLRSRVTLRSDMASGSARSRLVDLGFVLSLCTHCVIALAAHCMRLRSGMIFRL